VLSCADLVLSRDGGVGVLQLCLVVSDCIAEGEATDGLVGFTVCLTRAHPHRQGLPYTAGAVQCRREEVGRQESKLRSNFLLGLLTLVLQLSSWTVCEMHSDPHHNP
jgi:hypothetical protein